MRKVVSWGHVYSAESFNVDTVEQMNKNVAFMLSTFADIEMDTMVCVIVRTKALDGTYRISTIATSDIDVEEINIKNGSIGKLIFEGRE